MVSTIARDFLLLMLENKNSLFTDRSCPTLNTIMDCDDRIRDQIWTLLLTVCNTVVCFSLKIRVLQVILLSVFTLAPELSLPCEQSLLRSYRRILCSQGKLSFDCSRSEPEYVSFSATQLFAFPSKSVLQAILLSVFTPQNFRSEPTMRAVRQFIQPVFTVPYFFVKLFR